MRSLSSFGNLVKCQVRAILENHHVLNRALVLNREFLLVVYVRVCVQEYVFVSGLNPCMRYEMEMFYC